MSKIMVSPEELNTKGMEFHELASRFQRNTAQIYEKVESLRSQWSGEGYEAFYVRIRGFENDLESLRILMDKYGEFLEVTHANYLNAEANIIEQVRDKLSGTV